MIIAAADIGGTHSRWGLIEPLPNGGYHLLQAIEFSNASFKDFYSAFSRFLNQCQNHHIDRLSLAVAGPIDQTQIQLTNIDWQINRQKISRQFNISDLCIVNDLQAAALGTLHLEDHDLLALNNQPMDKQQCRVVIGAGTGLGLAYLHPQRQVQSPQCYATEGGHTQFSPSSDEQLRLLQFLQQKYARVSYERIVSGQGLVDLYAFAAGVEQKNVSPEWICHQAEMTSDPSTVKALRLWTEVYGSFAGNMATLFHPQGGIFLIGGLSNKLSYWLKSTTFYDAFIDQGRMQPRVKRIPVKLVTNDQVGLLGAIQFSLFDLELHKEVNR